MTKIESPEALGRWLREKPPRLSIALSSRIGLRSLPAAIGSSVRQLGGLDNALTISLFRAASISRAMCRTKFSDNTAARVAYHSAARAANSVRAATEFIPAFRVTAAEAVAESADSAATAAAFAIRNAAGRTLSRAITADVEARDATMDALNADCNWWEERRCSLNELLERPLWPGKIPSTFAAGLAAVIELGGRESKAWGNWVLWYKSRIDGHPGEWGLPAKQEKQMALRIIDASEDFWRRGEVEPAFVNGEIGRWLSELRADVERDNSSSDAPTLPGQARGAIVYTADELGRVTRAAESSQHHLRDLPAQRVKYQDIRVDVHQMLEDHGQRLGSKLSLSLLRLSSVMPENFEEAEAYPIWREIRRLSAVFEKHQVTQNYLDFDDNKLDPVCAVDLRVVVELANNFAFGDDGLRANDQKGVPLQLRGALDDEARTAIPLVAAVEMTPDIAVDEAREDLLEDTATISEAGDGPFDNQLVERATVARRNWFAALLVSASDFAEREGKKTGKSVREGMEREIGKQMLDLVMKHRDEFGVYAKYAFHSIDVSRMFAKMSEVWRALIG